MSVPIEPKHRPAAVAYALNDVEPEIAESVKQTLAVLEKLGAQIVPVTMPDVGELIENWVPHCAIEAAVAHTSTFPSRRTEYGPMWVTHKKNRLDHEAQYEHLVIMHDYYVFDSHWYQNFVTFGSDWDVCSNAQQLMNGKRHFTDWVVWDSPFLPRYTSLSYDDWSHTAYMYQSGGYMVIKKGTLKRFPLNEERGWGTGEDVEWSLSMRPFLTWKCNGKSLVTHNKQHRDCK